MSSNRIISIGVLAALALTGCEDRSKIESLEKDKAALQAKVTDAQAALDDANTELAEANKKVHDLAGELEAAKEQIESLKKKAEVHTPPATQPSE